jgi:hypothetical protein
MITIKCGINTLQLDIAGQTVSDIRVKCTSALNISEDMSARIDGLLAPETLPVEDDSTLEFVKVAGQKGALTVKCGVNTFTTEDSTYDTVGEVRDGFRSALNVDNSMEALVDGQPVQNDCLLSPNCTVEFVKKAGQKGN